MLPASLGETSGPERPQRENLEPEVTAGPGGSPQAAVVLVTAQGANATSCADRGQHLGEGRMWGTGLSSEGLLSGAFVMPPYIKPKSLTQPLHGRRLRTWASGQGFSAQRPLCKTLGSLRAEAELKWADKAATRRRS